MRYPPALTLTLRASWVYRSAAGLIAINLVALGARFIWAEGQFGLKNFAVFVLLAAAGVWLLRDAWKHPRGSLHYAQGQWRYLHGEREVQGTCTLHLDLQTYMLVSFRADSAQDKLFQTTTQWFHLEARHADHAALPANVGSWAALRRAVYSPMEPADEAVAA